MRTYDRSIKIAKPNDAWILHREEFDALKDGNCNMYVLLDAYSGFCFDLVSSQDLPLESEILDLLQEGKLKAGQWPKQVLILKSDPYVDCLKPITERLKIQMVDLPFKDLKPFVEPFSKSFDEFKTKGQSSVKPLSQAQKDEMKAFIPETYGPCPCASGKKFKFCCQRAFDDLVFALSAAEEGKLEEALHFMKGAESKLGLSAEILCRYSICWSFFDRKKSHDYLMRAAKENPNHPRTNYILGIEAASNKQYEMAVLYYRKAIDHYPKADRYHLNETYNNLGAAYFAMGRYQEAKEAWEKGLLLLPSDKMVKENLIEFIYENPVVPKSVREISPFIRKYLMRYEASY